MIYKNMPFLQIILNLPLLIPGFVVKWLFFVRKGFGKKNMQTVFLTALPCQTKRKKFRFRSGICGIM